MRVRRSGAASCTFAVLLGGLLLLGALESAFTLPAAQQQQQQHSSSFAPWPEPQQQHSNAAAASGRSNRANLQEHAAFTIRRQQRQKQQLLLRGAPSIAVATVGSPLRSLQQSATSYQPPKFFLSNVRAAVVNTYEWQISRQSTAGGVTLTANGQERQQMGYTLTYTKVLQKREFVVEGSADVTNLSGADKLTLMTLTVFVGSAETTPVCRSMPKSTYTMQPVEALKCPFKLVLTASPGAAQLTGFVQTIRSRVTAEPVPFSFEACGGGGSSSSSSGVTSFSSLGSTTAAPVGTAVTCTIQNVGDCVEITDGSFIQNKFRDVAGTAAAGEIPRSKLFAVGNNPSNPWSTSTQGPARTEPELPATPAAAAAADGADSSSNLADIAGADMPNASWWTHRRLRHHRRQRSLLTDPAAAAAADNTWVPTPAAAEAGVQWSGRALQQMPFSGGAGSQRGNQFKWPIPQVIGVRPPVGTDGKPSAAVPPKKICENQPFQFSMIFGPLLPEACGIFEVHNTAAAAYTDSSKPPASHTTYFYLTVHCPVPDPAAAAAATSGSQRFRSVEDINPAVGADAATAADSLTQHNAPDSPAQLSFSNFRRNEAARLYVAALRGSAAAVRRRPAVRPESATGGSSAARVLGPAVVSSSGSRRFYIPAKLHAGFRFAETPAALGRAVLQMGPVSTTDSNILESGNTNGHTTAAHGLSDNPARASFAQAAAEDSPSAASAANATGSSTATAASAQETAAAFQVQLPASKLRVTILEVQPTLLSSYPWSLSSKPVAEQVDNVTMVGCQLIATRERGVTGQLLIGTLRLGNPSRVTDADASVIRVTSVTVTAQVQSEAEGQLEPVSTVAECRSLGADGTLELMPWRRTNCSFEIKISASQEGKSLHTLTGDLTATAVIDANTPSAAPAAAAGSAAATQDVSSPPFPYEFIPKLLPATNSSTTANGTTAADGLTTNTTTNTTVTADTPSGIRNLAVGSCADLSAGVIVAEELPIDAAAQAAAVAAAGANGTTPDGRGGKCLRVCGLEFQAGTNVTVMTPLTGYAQQQCGTTQVYCMGALLPDNAGWQGQGKLSPAVVTTSSKLTISGLQCAADIKARLVNATAAETNSSVLAPPVGPPVQLLITDVKAQQVRQYSWTSNLTLGSTPVTANGSAAGDTIQLPAGGGAATLTLVAQHIRSALPVSGKVTGQLLVQANAARGGAAGSPGLGLLKPELTPQIEFVTGLAVYLIKPCGGVTQGNISGCDADPPQIKLPATCSFEFAGVNITDAAAGIIVANATATVVIPAPPPPPPPGSPEPASPAPGSDTQPPAGDAGGTAPPDDGTGAANDAGDTTGDAADDAAGDAADDAAGDAADDAAGDAAGDAASAADEAGDTPPEAGDIPPEAGDTPPQQPASFAQAGASFMQVTPMPPPGAPDGNVTDTAGDYKEPEGDADATAAEGDADATAAEGDADATAAEGDADATAADGGAAATPDPATGTADSAAGADAPPPAADDADTPPAGDGTTNGTASPAPAGDTGVTSDNVTAPSDTPPTDSNSTAATGTAPANGTASNSTSDAAAPTTVLIAVQSAPVTVLLSDAAVVEVDQCYNVTNSFKLTASGVTPNTQAADSGSNSTANVPQPVLLTTSELPPSGQLCFSSQITYGLQVGPVSSSSSSGSSSSSTGGA